MSDSGTTEVLMMMAINWKNMFAVVRGRLVEKDRDRVICVGVVQ